MQLFLVLRIQLARTVFLKIAQVICRTVFDFLSFVLKVFLSSMELPKRHVESDQESGAQLDITN